MADKIKLVLAALLFAAGVAGFYYLSDAAAIVRLAAIVAGAAAGIALAWFTVPGQQFLVFARDAVTEVKKNALLVPQRAVLDVQGVRQVAVVGADDTVEIRPVQVGPRTGSLWIIEQGVKPGERVVVEGLDKVRPGAKVKPEPASPSAPAGRGPSS